MTPNDKPQFIRIIDELADVLPTSASRIDAMKHKGFQFLSDISLDKMRKVARMAVQQLDAFPTVHKLRDLAGRTNTDACRLCAGDARISHVKAITIDYFAECMQSIPHTLEAVYGHCRTSYAESPEIRAWAKQAIAEHLGCSSLPYRLQSDEQRQYTRDALAKLGSPV